MPSKQVTTSAPTSRELVGLNIRSARIEAGLTQHDLAVAIGLREKQTVSNWERGLFKPTDENLAGLCQVLGRDFAWFYTDHDKAAAA